MLPLPEKAYPVRMDNGTPKASVTLMVAEDAIVAVAAFLSIGKKPEKQKHITHPEASLRASSKFSSEAGSR